MLPTLRIDITDEDIAMGVRACPDGCPLYHATARRLELGSKFSKYVSIRIGYWYKDTVAIFVYTVDHLEIYLLAELDSQRILQFDKYGKMLPFSLTVTRL